jgi:hypothetical protein
MPAVYAWVPRFLTTCKYLNVAKVDRPLFWARESKVYIGWR